MDKPYESSFAQFKSELNRIRQRHRKISKLQRQIRLVLGPNPDPIDTSELDQQLRGLIQRYPDYAGMMLVK